MGLSSKQVSSDHLELNWPQTTLGSDPNPRSTAMKRPLPIQQPEPLKCPRCDSSNTKFCYYNNYNKTQPRHFCKACKRHWTKGGTLRNVPVGGGRKNKRIKRPNAVVTPASANSDQLGFHDQKYVFSDDHKGVLDQSYSDIDQVSWDFNGFGGTATAQQELPHQNLGFSILSNLSSMDTNPSLIIPTSFSPLLAGFKDDSTRMMMGSSAAMNLSQPWMQVPSTSNLLEGNYWSWNDIDIMVQADLNKPFEDPQLKP